MHWLRKSGWRILPGLLAAGLTLVTARTGIFQSVEHIAYRALFQLRGEQPWNDQVVVIEIDEASLSALGSFPWPRHYYTDLLEKLTPAEPSVIAFDILFAAPSADDVDFAQAMAAHGNVVLATAWDMQGSVIGPNARVLAGAIATGPPRPPSAPWP
ncbi:MAG: CHASE2 domain-containing protein [Cyanobacteria bacterium J06642_11]